MRSLPLHKPAAAAIVLLSLWLGACSNKLPHEPTRLSDTRGEVDVEEVWSMYLAANENHQFRLFPPYFDGTDLYTVVQSGFVYKFSIKNGAPELDFRVDINADIHSGVTVVDDVIYLCAGDDRLLGISAEDGSPVEEIGLSTFCVAPPVFDNERAYVRLRDGTVVALDDSDEVVWSYSQGLINLSLDGNSPLLLYNDSLFFGTDTSKLFSLSPAKGDLYWSVNVGTPKTYTEIGLILDIDAPIEIWGNYLLVSSYQSRMMMVNSVTGRQIWELDVSTRTGIAVDDDGFGWVADSDGVMHCVELSTGNILWSADLLKYRTLSRPVKVGEAVVVSDRFGYLHVFSAAEGFYLGRERIRVARPERDPALKRHIRGRYQPKHKQTQLFPVWESLFASQDLSGRLVFYQLDR